jgi:hypothetical protein
MKTEHRFGFQVFGRTCPEPCSLQLALPKLETLKLETPFS